MVKEHGKKCITNKSTPKFGFPFDYGTGRLTHGRDSPVLRDAAVPWEWTSVCADQPPLYSVLAGGPSGVDRDEDREFYVTTVTPLIHRLGMKENAHAVE